MERQMDDWRILKRNAHSFVNHCSSLAAGQGQPFADGKNTSWGYARRTPLCDGITCSLETYLGPDVLEQAKSVQYNLRRRTPSFIKEWVKRFEESINLPPPAIIPSPDHSRQIIRCRTTEELMRIEGFDPEHLGSMPTITTKLEKRVSGIGICWGIHGLEITIRRGRLVGRAMEMGWFWKGGRMHINSGTLPKVMLDAIPGKSLDRITGYEPHQKFEVIRAGQKDGGPLVLGLELQEN